METQVYSLKDKRRGLIDHEFERLRAKKRETLGVLKVAAMDFADARSGPVKRKEDLDRTGKEAGQ